MPESGASGRLTRQDLTTLLAAAGITITEADVDRVKAIASSLLADAERLTARVDPTAQPWPSAPRFDEREPGHD